PLTMDEQGSYLASSSERPEESTSGRLRRSVAHRQTFKLLSRDDSHPEPPDRRSTANGHSFSSLAILSAVWIRSLSMSDGGEYLRPACLALSSSSTTTRVKRRGLATI